MLAQGENCSDIFQNAQTLVEICTVALHLAWMFVIDQTGNPKMSDVRLLFYALDLLSVCIYVYIYSSNLLYGN